MYIYIYIYICIIYIRNHKKPILRQFPLFGRILCGFMCPDGGSEEENTNELKYHVRGLSSCCCSISMATCTGRNMLR